MTKRLVVALVFLISAFSVSLFAVNSVDREIEAVLNEIENTEDVFLCSENILSMRKDNERVFSLFLKHTDADMIDRLHLNLRLALDERDEERVRILLFDIYSYLSVTAEGEMVKCENIF